MKMTKHDFKVMMKECLVELIQEGAFNIVAIQGNPSANLQESSTRKQQPQMNNGGLSSLARKEYQKRLMMMNEGTMDNDQSEDNSSDLENDPQYRQFAKEAATNAANLLGNSKYQKIFEDTMLHTLPKQANMVESVSRAEVERDKQKLANIPGFDPSSWQRLAFANGTKDRKNALYPGNENG